MPNKDADMTPAAATGNLDKDLLDLLAQLDKPLEPRLVERGYENLRTYLSRPKPKG